MWLEEKYISILGPRLRNFKRKSQNLYNFSCPICGDSTKDKKKARGYLYTRKGEWWFTCHNCGLSANFKAWLKSIDKGLHDSYMVEGFHAPKNKPRTALEDFQVEMKPLSNRPLEELLKLSDAPSTHPARLYVEKERLLDPIWLPRIYYTERFKAWTNSQLPGKYEHEDLDRPMIVMPFFDKTGVMYGYQGRFLDNNSPRLRYLTIMLDEMRPKVWGQDTCDMDRDFFMMEGPIDAMCLSNAMATCGGKISSELMKLGKEYLDRAVIVYDNERKNSEVVSNVRKAVRAGYKVVIWPKEIIFPWKDVNKAIQEGMPAMRVEALMKEHTFQGLDAETQFEIWSRDGLKR
jgi:hypothetical protein